MRSHFWLVAVGVLLFLLGTAIEPERVYGTSWVEFQPEEVIEKAEVIVLGRYNFNQGKLLPEPNDSMWMPFTFEAEKYYKGSGEKLIIAAIEQYDVGWAQEFQEQGGVFMLFLEKDEKNEEILITVGGPNGMVQILNGDIQNLSSEEARKYNDFLPKQKPVAPTPNEGLLGYFEKSQWGWLMV
ncbi:MAG: hypothetical protein AAGU27_25180, partial [Dehalobacterium sp.]